jgi:hypothetical protein
MRFAWCLNLDAEEELKAQGRYTPTRRIAEQIRAQLPSFRQLTNADPILEHDEISSEEPVLCWCPTPSALGQIVKQRLSPVGGPSLDVLRIANHRGFSCAFADASVNRCFVQQSDAWESLLFEQASASGAWRLKRAFGWAGRGQRRISSSPSEDDLRWVRDSLRAGGLLRERELLVREEYSTHGYVDPEELDIGQPVRFWSDRFGAPLKFESLGAPSSALASELRDAACAVAYALRREDYFGPFGVDAMVWQDGPKLRLNSVSDINARFTLAWSLGMGEERTYALTRYAARHESNRGRMGGSSGSH